MQQIENYIQQFDTYVNTFLGDDVDEATKVNIRLKITHSKHVLEHARNIATDENLSPIDFFTAELCGLFHDIGRFEQFTKFKTFRDNDLVYHGKLGVEVIEQQKFLQKLPLDIHDIVTTAIYNHGLKHIDSSLAGKKLLFAKLIRDADKADIFNIVAHYYHTPGPRNIALEYGLKNPPCISQKVLQTFLNKQTIDKSDLQTLNDFKLMQLAWVFDCNFNYTKKFIAQHDFINIILKSISDNSHKNEIRQIATEALKF